MAYKIQYDDFDGKTTIISIFKGVESGYALDYKNRVYADFVETIYSTTIETEVIATGPTGMPPEYGGMELCSITFEPRTFHFKQQRITFEHFGYEAGNGVYGEGNWPTVTNCPSNSYYKTQCEPEIVGTTTSGGTYEGAICLRDKIDRLNGEGRDFCAGDEPLRIEWYATDKYTKILGSGVDIQMIIQNETDGAALLKILDGGYYITITKDDEIFWLGRLTSRYYTEPYKTYPYMITLTGSDQVATLNKYQPIMIDYNLPDTMSQILQIFNKVLVGEHMYPDNFVGNKLDTLWFGNRITHEDFTNILEGVYADPLNWMDKETNEYASYKTILEDILTAFNSKMFQWKGEWYVMGQDAQYNDGDVNLRGYNLSSDFGTSVIGNVDFPGVYYYPYTCAAEDDSRSVYDNAEISYEPPYRKLEITQNFNKTIAEIDGFCNANGQFYEGQDNKSLEFDLDTHELRHWSGDKSFVRPLNSGSNDGWAYVMRVSNTTLRIYKSTIIEKGEYDTFNFSVDGIAANGSRLQELYFNVKLTQNGVDKWLEYDGDWQWCDTYRSFSIDFSSQSTTSIVDIEYPFDDSDNKIYDTVMRVDIRSIPFPYGAKGGVAIKKLQCEVNYSDWEATDYQNIYYKDINIPNSDATIIDLSTDWGIVIEELTNLNHIHRSAAYDVDGQPLFYWNKNGWPTGTTNDKTLMDWLGMDLYNDNLFFSPTITGSYRTYSLTPLSFIVDTENRIYRFVSGVYNDRRGIWDTIHTQAKWLIPLGDYSSLDNNSDYFTVI